MDFLLRTFSAGTFKEKSESELSLLTEKERGRYKSAERTYNTFQTHQMRKGAFWVMGFSLVALVALVFVKPFSSFPKEEDVVSFSNFLRQKVQMPWGQINILISIVFAAVGAFLIFTGSEGRKLKRPIAQSCFCIILGILVILWGIFQWDMD